MVRQVDGVAQGDDLDEERELRRHDVEGHAEPADETSCPQPREERGEAGDEDRADLAEEEAGDAKREEES